MRGSHSSRFEQALVYAYEAHGEQTRKGGDIPYMSHLMAVCGLVMEHGGTEDQCIAALLHDAVEDQGGRAKGDDIEQRFGIAVRRIVDGCSDTDVTPKPPWRERKEAYIAHLREATDEIRLVSCCDKIHNARTLLADLRIVGPSMWGRFNASPAETIWYFRSIVQALRDAGGPLMLADELERTIDALEALMATSQT